MLLLVLPLIILAAAYTMISRTLWQSIDAEEEIVRHQTAGWIYFYIFIIFDTSSLMLSTFSLSFVRFEFYYHFIIVYCAVYSDGPSTRKRQKVNDAISFQKLRNSSQEIMLLNRDSKKRFGLRR
jgi:hypothetical protein